MDIEELKARLLHKLTRHRMWGGKHTAFDNLQKGFPSHLAKDVKEAAEELIRQGILAKKPTGYGLHVFLNPRKKKEIIEIVEKYFKAEF